MSNHTETAPPGMMPVVWQNRLARLARPDMAALLLRVGIGLVFVIGGTWKLSRLLHPEYQADILARY